MPTAKALFPMPRHPSHAARARATAVLLASSVLVTGAVSPWAHAADDDLRKKKQQVEKKIDVAHDDLHESSAQLRKAAGALAAARSQLSAAQAHLADTRGQLSAAEALDKQLAAELVVATARLRKARAEVVDGRRDIVAQQDELGQLIVANYQTGDPSLMGLSMVLTSQDPAELTGQLNSVQNVMDKESVVLDRLEASRVLLSVQEQEVAAAKAEVSARRAEAARNLARKQALEEAAETAEASVADLVEARATAQDAAEEARKADLAQLESLDAERLRIAAILKQRADAARARAAAAAAAAGEVGPVLGDGGPVQSTGFLNFPVAGSVTSPYGWRTHPIYGYRALHDGVDFGAPCGTPIRATAGGVVLERYFQTAWGNRVIIDHGVHAGVGVATISNHLASQAVVSPGQRVRRGQIVGYVGSTGWSTGCHLHFTVLQNGVAVDPMGWF